MYQFRSSSWSFSSFSSSEYSVRKLIVHLLLPLSSSSTTTHLSLSPHSPKNIYIVVCRLNIASNFFYYRLLMKACATSRSKTNELRFSMRGVSLLNYNYQNNNFIFLLKMHGSYRWDQISYHILKLRFYWRGVEWYHICLTLRRTLKCP